MIRLMLPDLGRDVLLAKSEFLYVVRSGGLGTFRVLVVVLCSSAECGL